MKKIFTSPLCSCIICKKTYSAKGIHSHYNVSHTSDGKANLNKARLIGSRKGGLKTAKNKATLKNQSIIDYNINPVKCKQCNEDLSYDKFKSNNKFCNSSCSAKYNNIDRAKNGYIITNEHKLKISNTWKSKFVQKKPWKCNPVGPYSKLFKCTCKHCGTKLLLRTQAKYCNNCDHLYSNNGRAKFWFTFNVFHYPELFDLSLITTFGFRDSKTNPNGITRDHRLSVNDAIRNNYNPYYIKHPLNCELMFFNDNNKKKTNSSISYEELVKIVDEYDKAVFTPDPHRTDI